MAAKVWFRTKPIASRWEKRNAEAGNLPLLLPLDSEELVNLATGAEIVVAKVTGDLVVLHWHPATARLTDLTDHVRGIGPAWADVDLSADSWVVNLGNYLNS